MKSLQTTSFLLKCSSIRIRNISPTLVEQNKLKCGVNPIICLRHLSFSVVLAVFTFQNVSSLAFPWITHFDNSIYAYTQNHLKLPDNNFSLGQNIYKRHTKKQWKLIQRSLLSLIPLRSSTPIYNSCTDRETNYRGPSNHHTNGTPGGAGQ